MFVLRVLVVSIASFLCCAQSYLNVTEDPYYFDSLAKDFENKRESVIHKLCTHRSRFTEKELEIARVYLQTRYINGANVKPLRAACKSLKVIRDFKCLSHEERLEFVDAFQKLYSNGVIDRISYFHGGYWPFVHLTVETFPFHNKFLNDLQHELEKINPSVIMPYWDTTLDFAAPHKSIVWEYFGRAGNESNDYCVPDGTFKNPTVKYPTPHCLRREWNSDGSIPAWESPELLTSALQLTIHNRAPFSGIFIAEHFKKHLNIGGFNGDMSIPYATNEPLFHLYHLYNAHIQLFKWHLELDENLVPTKINVVGHHEPRYEYEGKMVDASIENDTILGYNTTTLAEAFTYAFGDFCYISDQMIEQINNLFNNVKPKPPVALQRLRNALPAEVFAKYFPFFTDDRYSELLHSLLPDVGNGSNTSCTPLPLPPNYNATEHGKKQFDAFNQLGKDSRNHALDAEQQIIEFIDTLNQYNYCSPYVA